MDCGGTSLPLSRARRSRSTWPSLIGMTHSFQQLRSLRKLQKKWCKLPPITKSYSNKSIALSLISSRKPQGSAVGTQSCWSSRMRTRVGSSTARRQWCLRRGHSWRSACASFQRAWSQKKANKCCHQHSGRSGCSWSCTRCSSWARNRSRT